MKEAHILPQLARGTTIFGGSFTPLPASAQQADNQYLCNDGHVYITNYIQEGTDIHVFPETDT